MFAIPDFTEPELDVVKDLQQLRFKQTVEIHLADAELRLNRGSNEFLADAGLQFRDFQNRHQRVPLPIFLRSLRPVRHRTRRVYKA